MSWYLGCELPQEPPEYDYCDLCDQPIKLCHCYEANDYDEE